MSSAILSHRENIGEMVEKSIPWTINESGMKGRIEELFRRKFGNDEKNWPTVKEIHAKALHFRSESMVYKYRQGQELALPSLEVIVNFARWLGVTVDELLGLKDLEPQSVNPIPYERQLLAQDLVEITEVQSMFEAFREIVSACKRDRENQIMTASPPGPNSEQRLQNVAKAEQTARQETTREKTLKRAEAAARRAANIEGGEGSGNDDGAPEKGHGGSVESSRKGPQSKPEHGRTAPGNKGFDKKSKA